MLLASNRQTMRMMHLLCKGRQQNPHSQPVSGGFGDATYNNTRREPGVVLRFRIVLSVYVARLQRRCAIISPPRTRIVSAAGSGTDVRVYVVSPNKVPCVSNLLNRANGGAPMFVSPRKSWLTRLFVKPIGLLRAPELIRKAIFGLAGGHTMVSSHIAPTAGLQSPEKV